MTSPSSSPERWFHPLIARPEPRLNRRRLIVMSGSGLAAAVATRPELRVVTAQTPEASPAATPASLTGVLQDQVTGDEDAVALLRDAAQAMAALQTFSFEVETIRGESTIFEGLAVELIEGAVRRPTDFTATVIVSLPFGTVEVTAVGVEGKAWVQDPLSDGEWIELEGAEDILPFVNPDTLILSSIGLVKDAAIDGDEKIDGEETTRIAGMVNFAETAAQLSDGTMELPPEISSEPLPVLIWVDGERHVRVIEVSGPIVTTESADVVREIRFFDFDQPVEIEAPQT